MKDIEKLIEKAESGYTATIVKIEKTTSTVFYGSTKYDDREGYEVTYKLNDDDLEWSEFYNIPKPLGIEESKIYLFKKEYGELPKEGMKVVAVVLDGFFKVKF